MSAALLQLKELAVLLCDQAVTLPRGHKWQQPWASACRVLLERNMHDADLSHMVACRVSTLYLTTGLPEQNLYFAPNITLQDFLQHGMPRRVTVGHAGESLDKRLRGTTQAYTGVYSTRLNFQNSLSIVPGIQPRCARPRRVPCFHPPLHAADLARFTSDARRLAPVDKNDPPQSTPSSPSTHAQEAAEEHSLPETSATPNSSDDKDTPLPPPPSSGSTPAEDGTTPPHPAPQPSDGQPELSLKTGTTQAMSSADLKDVFVPPASFPRSKPPHMSIPASRSIPFQIRILKRQLRLAVQKPPNIRKTFRGGLTSRRSDGVPKSERASDEDITQRLELKNPRMAQQSGRLWLVWDEAVRAGLGHYITCTEEMQLAEWLQASRSFKFTAKLRNDRGQRLKKLLDRVEQRTSHFAKFRQLQGLHLQFECLRIYQYSLLDDWQTVQTSLHDLLSRNDGVKEPTRGSSNLPLVNLIRFLLQDALQYDGPLRVIDLILDNFLWLEPPIRRLAVETFGYRVQWYHQSKYLQLAADKAISKIRRPVEFLDDKLRLWDEQRLRRAARLLLQSFIRQDEPEIAYAIYLWQRRNQVHIPVQTLGDLCDLLVLGESYAEAEGVFQRLQDFERDVGKKTRPEEWYPKTMRVGLRLSAHQGDVDGAETYYRLLKDHAKAYRFIFFHAGAGALRLHAYAVAGRMEDLEKIFASMFPTSPGTGGPETRKSDYGPRISDYVALILGYARRGDLESANRWLSVMAKAGIQPNLYVYNIILGELTTRGDVDGVRAVLGQMERANIKRNRQTYVCIVNMYAALRDPVRAEEAFQQALQDGIRPHGQLFNRLVNAHVEAASWPGVIRAFDYMMNLPYRTLSLSIGLCNILLKAYVLIGAPHYAVRGVFSRLADFGAIPNVQSYCLLIQSAVDSDRMGEANRIFRQMQSALRIKPSDPTNVYPLTMLVSGHLRRGELEQARARYNEMIENDIQPSTSTFAAIIRSYASGEDDDGLRIAEDFLKQVLDNPGDRNKFTQPRNPANTLTYLFVPVMKAHARRSDSSEVERVYGEFLEKGGRSDISTLSILLHAYGLSGDIEAVVQVWEEIHKLGLDLLNHKSVFPGVDTLDKEAGRPHTIWLAYALSVYIDTLSTAGRHTTIAETLAMLRKEGFVFSANNWNHIAIAMMRAGEPERAFEVLERVILRYQAESERLMQERDIHPDSPFVFNRPKEAGAVEKMDHRASGAQERKVLVYKAEQAVPYPGTDIKGEEQIRSIEDLIHSLHILHQVSPAWHLWKPYPSLLKILGAFLTADSQEDREIDLGLSAGGGTQEILQRIYANYPAAVEAVRTHQRMLESRQPRSQESEYIV
ncbi:hypothetical protein CALVIDRAFT_496708 [Calocera viscosa TUFC12733]|uniref:Pentacotripeptide-repeat region of PRORP domain-containing protein n=1 Tax=Calocera viscosa (strain TUFC12733) TaxID=1330018 RepID=A0A167NVK5_CALVF|nr:hypothetical protein CALVIDRAFT_496708 [Calocera viscosa TUFC12733]